MKSLLNNNLEKNHKKSNNTKKKEKITNFLFSNKQINKVNHLLNQENYIIEFFWNFLDIKLDNFLKLSKNKSSGDSSEYLLSFKEYAEKIIIHIETNETEDIQIFNECNIFFKKFSK